MRGNSPVRRLDRHIPGHHPAHQVTGFVFFHPPPSPRPGDGIVALLVLAPQVYALYLNTPGHLAVGLCDRSGISLYLNVFVLVSSVPESAQARITGGPAFGAVQGICLIAFILAGCRA